MESRVEFLEMFIDFYKEAMKDSKVNHYLCNVLARDKCPGSVKNKLWLQQTIIEAGFELQKELGVTIGQASIYTPFYALDNRLCRGMTSEEMWMCRYETRLSFLKGLLLAGSCADKFNVYEHFGLGNRDLIRRNTEVSDEDFV
jgi:hypothetical protein